MLEEALSKTKFSKQSVKAGGCILVVAVVAGSIMKGLAKSDVEASRKLLLERGLFKPEDL